MATNLSSNPVAEAFFKACTDFRELADGISCKSYDETGVGTWSIVSVMGHVYRGLVTTLTYLDTTKSDIDPQIKTIDEFYLAINLKDPALLERVEDNGVEEGLLIRDNPVAHIDEVISQLGSKLAEVDLNETITIMNGITIPIKEYLKIRIVELTVHTIDLYSALKLESKLSEDALEICIGVLVGCHRQYDKMVNLLAALTGRKFNIKDISVF